MAEDVERNDNSDNGDETPSVPQMTTVERAEMLLAQDAAIRAKINGGATLDEAVDPSNKEFGPLAHPEQVQMRVAKRAMMLRSGIPPYPVHLDVTTTIEAVRAKYDGKLEAGQETDDMVGIAGRVLFLRNAGGLCFVQLSAGDGTKIQGMISKKEIGADSLKQFKQLVDLGDHLYLKGRVISSKTGELSVFATEWAIASKALQPLPALHKELNEDTRTRKPYIGMIADERIRNMVRNRSKAVASLRKTTWTSTCASRRNCSSSAAWWVASTACSRSTATSATRASTRRTPPSSPCSRRIRRMAPTTPSASW